MADFLHNSFNLNRGDIVEVTLDQQANVILLTDIDFHHYQRGEQFRYYGGLAKMSPFQISAPHAGTWHLVIDLGGRSGTLRHSVRTISLS